jgi:hypothetical protein
MLLAGMQSATGLPCPVVAQFVYSSDHIMPHQQPYIVYFTLQQLHDFLYNHDLQHPSVNGILQQFVPPSLTRDGGNAVFKAVWSPVYSSVQYRVAHAHLHDNRISLPARCATFDGDDTRSSLRPIPSTAVGITERSRQLCQSIADHFDRSNDAIRTRYLEICFKLDDRQRIWLLYCRSMRQVAAGDVDKVGPLSVCGQCHLNVDFAITAQNTPAVPGQPSPHARTFAGATAHIRHISEEKTADPQQYDDHENDGADTESRPVHGTYPRYDATNNDDGATDDADQSGGRVASSSSANNMGIMGIENYYSQHGQAPPTERPNNTDPVNAVSRGRALREIREELAAVKRALGISFHPFL